VVVLPRASVTTLGRPAVSSVIIGASRPSQVDENVGALEARMHELAEADLPIQRFEVPIEQAIAEFQARDDQEKASLMMGAAASGKQCR